MLRRSTRKEVSVAREKKDAKGKAAEAAEGVLDAELVEKLDELIKDSGKKVKHATLAESLADDELNDKQMEAVVAYFKANGVKVEGKAGDEVAAVEEESVDTSLSDEEIMEGIPEEELQASKAVDEILPVATAP